MNQNEAATPNQQTSSSDGAWVAASSRVDWAPGLSSSRTSQDGRATIKLAAADGSVVGISHLSRQLSVAPPVLVVTDGDSTLIHQEVINELAKVAGVGDQVRAITREAMHGNLDFSKSLAARVALLGGMEASALAQVRDRLTLMPGAATLVKWAHSVGAKFAVVSGGFKEVLQPFADQLGVDYLVANELEVRGGRLTGRVSGPIVDATTKKHYLEEWSGHQPSRAAAVGDGANDIPMLEAAGAGIAFCAKPAVRDAAPSYLDVPRLDAVIKLLGG